MPHILTDVHVVFVGDDGQLFKEVDTFKEAKFKKYKRVVSVAGAERQERKEDRIQRQPEVAAVRC